jgi:hypothetical protein
MMYMISQEACCSRMINCTHNRYHYISDSNLSVTIHIKQWGCTRVLLETFDVRLVSVLNTEKAKPNSILGICNILRQNILSVK